MRWMLFLMILIINISFSQERIDSEQPSINKTAISSLNQAIGYLKNDIGKWNSKQNRIPFKLEPQFESLSNFEIYSLGENKENFTKFEFRKITINDSTYSILIKYYKSGFYEYPTISKGWVFSKSLDFYVFNNSDVEKLKTFKKDSINNIKIKPLFVSTLEYLDEYKLSYVENKIQELIIEKDKFKAFENQVEDRYNKTKYLYFNFLYYKDKVRFKIDVFDFDLKDEYYETDKNNFENFYIKFLNG